MLSKEFVECQTQSEFIRLNIFLEIMLVYDITSLDPFRSIH